MIPTLFFSVDVADARGRALDFAASEHDVVTHIEGPLTVAEVFSVNQNCSPLHLQVVNIDGVSQSASTQLLSLVRQGKIIGYSTSVKHAPGVHVQRSGLLPDDVVYRSCVDAGMTSTQALQAAKAGRGSVDAAVAALPLLSRRGRVLKLLDAVSAHNMTAVQTTAAEFTGTDILLVRHAVTEIRSGEWAVWSEREVEIFSTHIEFVASTISDYYVQSPAATALTLGMGLYFAECGLL